MSPRCTEIFLALARIAVAGVLVFVLTCAAISLDAWWLDSRTTTPPPAAVIVVLGGGVRADGTPGPDSLRRTSKGIALYQAGVAPRLHFTGGHRNPDVLGLGQSMALVATASGIPEDVVSTESLSRSTLQNALLSADVIPPATTGPIVLVSDGYHLARAWVSFRWAGYGPVYLSAASAFGEDGLTAKLRRIGREALAWWFNAGRIAVWSLLDLFGMDRKDSLDLLAGQAQFESA